MTRYIPPYPLVKQQFAIASLKGEPWASIRVEALESLISSLLQAVAVDEEWYLSTYPDVAEAVKSGIIPSARAHFIRNGYFEGRRPFAMEVDEAWYVSAYPDIGDAISKGGIESAATHFREHGYDEGRLPAEVA